jgi:hypothetical protein
MKVASEKRRPSSSLVSPLMVTLMVILGAYWEMMSVIHNK